MVHTLPESGLQVGVAQRSVLGPVLFTGGCGVYPYISGWGRLEEWAIRHLKLQPRKLKIQVWSPAPGPVPCSSTGRGTTLLTAPGGPGGWWAKCAPTLCPGMEAYEAVLAEAQPANQEKWFFFSTWCVLGCSWNVVSHFRRTSTGRLLIKCWESLLSHSSPSVLEVNKKLVPQPCMMGGWKEVAVNWSKSKRGCSLMWSETLPLWGWTSSGMGCLESYSFHVLKYSRSSWVKPWVSCSDLMAVSAWS